MFSFKGVSEGSTRKKGMFIRPGSGLVVKVNDIILEKSVNHEFRKPVLFMESEPITEEGWVGHEGAVGQIGKIAANGGFYLKTEAQQQEFVAFLKEIVTALGKEEECATIEASTLEEFVSKVKAILANAGYARYFVRGVEYAKSAAPNGKGLKLLFPNRRFVESLSTASADSKLAKFDYKNKWHYDRLPQVESQATYGELGAPAITSTETVDDLPF
jgi:hypothetical protein